MSDEAKRKEAFLRNKERCITHMKNHRIYFQPGDRYEKVLFQRCYLHGPEEPSRDIHFTGCVFWECRYFKGETEVPTIYEAMGGDKYVEINDEEKKKAMNGEEFRSSLDSPYMQLPPT